MSGVYVNYNFDQIATKKVLSIGMISDGSHDKNNVGRCYWKGFKRNY